MSQLLSQIILPAVLAFIMLAMGLGLSPRHFSAVLRAPAMPLLGLVLQLLLLPALALVVIAILGLDGPTAAGLFLLSLCPGGATSNLFAYLANGQVALSIALTAISSLLVPFTLPLLFGLYLAQSGSDATALQLPIGPTINQLLIVTFVPVLVGMAIRHWASAWADRLEPWSKRLGTGLMLIVVLGLIVTNWPLLQDPIKALAVLMLSCTAMLLSGWIAFRASRDAAIARTLAVEVGIQNAGTALLVAISLMHQPALAVVPLIYGVLMNVPGFGFVAWVRYRDGRASAVSAT
ncbi:bile acid:sodium symporter family protein [Saccharospirillum mangrovi]|uniref:bile acid:sodium symporter family protein n=1 Tax=Saccharospirillum mangrovi TaxID=2161747 RepID=UPI000D34F5C3|nr:bile acid:sodium symporter family protein [Saccharospirillum mangrovi]